MAEAVLYLASWGPQAGLSHSGSQPRWPELEPSLGTVTTLAVHFHLFNAKILDKILQRATLLHKLNMHAPGLSWKYYLLGVAAHWTSKPPPADPAEALEARRAAMRGFSKPSFLMGYPSPMESVVDGEVAGRPVRRYTPQRPLPGTIVFFHGGGFVIGDLDTHDVLARALATGTQRRVVSVDYRLAPEHPFPAAVTDCVAVTRALAAEEGAGSLALFGDSAGGNLAAVAANACASSDPRIPIIAQVSRKVTVPG